MQEFRDRASPLRGSAVKFKGMAISLEKAKCHAGIHLKSRSIDWLTISSGSTQFQSTGTINGEGLYTFRVQAKDNGEPDAGSDHFNIKIRDGTDTKG